MRYLFFFLFVIVTGLSYAQDTVYFKDCIEASVKAAPRWNDKQLLSEQLLLTNENIKTAWYPQLELNGKASYQSDVVSLQIDQPGIVLDFPEMPHEQYGVNLDIKQMIYDGGLSREKMKYEQIATQMSLQEIENDFHKLKELTSNAYFSILLFDESRNALEISLSNLKALEKQLVTSVRNGVAREADLKLIRVEIMQVLQQLSEIDAARQGMTDFLGFYTSLKIDSETVFDTPFLTLASGDSLKRPEIELFDLQKSLLDVSSDLASVARKPVFYAFGQAGAGMPGYNMLNSEFDTYYMVGAGMNWKIWDWNKVKREKQVVEKRKQMLVNREETFELSVESAQAKEIRKMEQLRKNMALDDKMLEMRIELTSVAASELENGIISGSEYVQTLNNESITRISKAKHHIELMKSIANYNMLQGVL